MTTLVVGASGAIETDPCQAAIRLAEAGVAQAGRGAD